MGELRAIKILGIDPGLNHTGWGIISTIDSKVSWVAHGVISPPSKMELSSRLGTIANAINDIIDAYNPDEAAVEETFVANSNRSSLLLGHARGAAIAILALRNLHVGEYATRLIKKAVVGTGTADKDQVAFMVKRLLPNAVGEDRDKMDAYDALAAAICHASMRRTNQMLNASQNKTQYKSSTSKSANAQYRKFVKGV